MKSYKNIYSQALNSLGEKLHFSAHSHHLWPDASLEGQKKYALEGILQHDNKWDQILGVELKKAQNTIAKYIGLSHPEQLAIAPNTNTLFFRLFSCFNLCDYSSDKPLKVLTTDSEFTSFNRQIERINELDNVSIEKVPAFPLESFPKRFLEASKKSSFEIVFFSRVFFNSGYVYNNIEELLDSQPNAKIVVDDYHGFCAIPVDISKVENKIFYMAGSYKYAQGGEGLCFMTLPKDHNLRPLYTGWFADYSSTLKKPGDLVEYDPTGFGFWGSTVDLSALYRFNAVHTLLKDQGLSIEVIHSHVENLKGEFLKGLKNTPQKLLNPEDLVLIDGQLPESHFLTFKTNNAENIHKTLMENKIQTDFRGDRLRFGFGLYQDLIDIHQLFRRLKNIK